MRTCPKCRGKGLEYGGINVCSRCIGAGQVANNHISYPGCLLFVLFIVGVYFLFLGAPWNPIIEMDLRHIFPSLPQGSATIAILSLALLITMVPAMTQDGIGSFRGFLLALPLSLGRLSIFVGLYFLFFSHNVNTMIEPHLRNIFPFLPQGSLNIAVILLSLFTAISPPMILKAQRSVSNLFGYLGWPIDFLKEEYTYDNPPKPKVNIHPCLEVIITLALFIVIIIAVFIVH